MRADVLRFSIYAGVAPKNFRAAQSVGSHAQLFLFCPQFTPQENNFEFLDNFPPCCYPWDMKELSIKLLHQQHGWSADQIALHLELPHTYVEKAIEALGSSTEFSSEVAVKSIQDSSAARQMELEPLYTVIEIALLEKLKETIELMEPQRVDAPVQISNLVKAYKGMTTDSIANKVIEDAANKNGIAIQIINTIS